MPASAEPEADGVRRQNRRARARAAARRSPARSRRRRRRPAGSAARERGSGDRRIEIGLRHRLDPDASATSTFTPECPSRRYTTAQVAARLGCGAIRLLARRGACRRLPSCQLGLDVEGLALLVGELPIVGFEHARDPCGTGRRGRCLPWCRRRWASRPSACRARRAMAFLRVS